LTALKALTEEEKYLVAILTDPSGSELAEFLFEDNMQDPKVYPYGRYRLWPMQWPYYHDDSKYQVDASGRGIGKSVSAVLRACAFPFAQQGKEMLVTAPELNHVKLLTDKIEENLMKYRILRTFLPNEGRNRRDNGITNSPQFQVNFTNGTKIMSRLPNRDGRGVKGTHPLVIEHDEVQDYPESGFTELTETIRISEPGAMWRIHGVSSGVGDLHYRLTESSDPRMPFKVHKYMAMHRPTWNDEERQAKLAMYGGAEDHPDYVRNIFGRPGSANSPIFVLSRLMACTRIHESDWATDYNENVYRHIDINDEARRRKLEFEGMEIEDLVDIPLRHLSPDYRSYWMGMDIGFTTDPTEILVWGSTKVAEDGVSRDVDRLLLRVSLTRIAAPIQRRVILHLNDVYGDRLRRIALDKTGVGLPVYQELMADTTVTDKIAGYGFAEKVTVDVEDRELLPGEKPEDLFIKKYVVDYGTDALRTAVDDKALELPYDMELLRHWQMQNMANRGTKEGKIRKYWGGPEHTLDAARMYIVGKNLMSVEKLTQKPKQESIITLFI